MSSNRTGFTPLKIASLVVGGFAIISHITAVAYPEWDGIDAQWRPTPYVPITFPIKAYGSLWDFTLVTDGSRKMFYQPAVQHLTDTAWKTPIILMATTGIGFGILGEGLIILAALLIKCTTRVGVHICVKMLATTSILCTSFECLMGAILYRHNYTKHEAPKDLNYNRHLPYGEHVLRAGFFLECAAGGLFLFNSLLFILDAMMSNRQETSSINPTLKEESVSSTQNK